MRRKIGLALSLLALGGAPAGAHAPAHHVAIVFAAFDPAALDVLPGETVQWSNVSARLHTVTADDGTFESGNLESGNRFTRAFTSTGTYAYHCSVHPGMIGEIDVRRVTLETLPPTAVLAGTRVEFAGRTATPALRVVIQRKSGHAFVPVGSVRPAVDGTWRTTLPAGSTGVYRAASGNDTSEARSLYVTNRTIHVRATRRGVAVSVTPSAPNARIALQQYERERFGWWPVRRTRLDYVSEAAFTVKGPARVRVVMLAPNGWTPIAVSRALSLRR